MLRVPRVLSRPIKQQISSKSLFNQKRLFHQQNKSGLFSRQSTPSITLIQPVNYKTLLLAGTSVLSAPILLKKPVQCQPLVQSPPVVGETTVLQKKPLFRKEELSFGAFLGICTGFLIKKVGKIFAAFVGTGFVFLQYLSHEGYITVNWDRLEGRYTRTLDLDKDGVVTKKDINTRWNSFINLLTQNIQFKSTFLIGLYTGLRYG